MRCFVIGNITIDTTLAIQDIPEAGMSIHGREVAISLGGKGCNQAIVLARAGVETTLIAAIGNDERAKQIKDLLSSEPVNSVLFTLPDCSSDSSIILSAANGDNANVTTTLCAENLPVDLALSAMAGAAPGDILIVQGNLRDETTLAFLEFAKSRGMVTAFNPSPLRPSMKSMLGVTDIVFLNESETQSLVGGLDECATRKLREAGPRCVVITLGSRGALLAVGDETLQIPSIPCDVVDTTGAGDTFMATALASAALRRCDLDRQALIHAAAAAALTVGRLGTQMAFPTSAEMAELLALTAA